MYRPIPPINLARPEEPNQHGWGNVSWSIQHDPSSQFNMARPGTSSLSRSIQHDPSSQFSMARPGTSSLSWSIQHGWDNHSPSQFSMTRRANSAWLGECLTMLPQTSTVFLCLTLM
jgi:hypothetical protein